MKTDKDNAKKNELSKLLRTLSKEPLDSDPDRNLAKEKAIILLNELGGVNALLDGSDDSLKLTLKKYKF